MKQKLEGIFVNGLVCFKLFHPSGPVGGFVHVVSWDDTKGVSERLGRTSVSTGCKCSSASTITSRKRPSSIFEWTSFVGPIILWTIFTLVKLRNINSHGHFLLVRVLDPFRSFLAPSFPHFSLQFVVELDLV